MYIPRDFVQHDDERTGSLVDSYSFGLLVTVDGDGLPVASHIPFLRRFDDDGLLLEGHIARPNPQTEPIRQGARALAVFQGPHTYISPTWYHSPGVPTWNYEAVHVYGSLRELNGEQARSVIERLAGKFEGDGPGAWQPSYPDAMLGGITCFAMSGLEVQSKSKMSQNRPEADRRGVMEALAASPEPETRAVLEIMRGIESGSRDDS